MAVFELLPVLPAVGVGVGVVVGDDEPLDAAVAVGSVEAPEVVGGDAAEAVGSVGGVSRPPAAAAAAADAAPLSIAARVWSMAGARSECRVVISRVAPEVGDALVAADSELAAVTTPPAGVAPAASDAAPWADVVTGLPRSAALPCFVAAAEP